MPLCRNNQISNVVTSIFIGLIAITYCEVTAQEHSSSIPITFETFIDPLTSDYIGRPTVIDADSSGLLIADQGYMRVTKVSYDGDVVFEFGREGRGPGEFEVLSGLWAYTNSTVVYDFNTFKFVSIDQTGNLIRETRLTTNPANPDSEYAIPITLDAVSDSMIVIPVYGRGDALFAIADLKTNTTTYLGTPVVPYTYMDDTEVDRAFLKGDNPSAYQNFILLDSNTAVIYCFIQTTGTLQKYSLDGELLWTKELSYLGQTGLFDEIKSYNLEMRNSPHVQRYFFKARAMKAVEDGVIVLLNMPDDEALTIAWISEDGSTVKFAKAIDLNNDRFGLHESITVSHNSDYIFYLKKSTGVIYRFHWPF